MAQKTALPALICIVVLLTRPVHACLHNQLDDKAIQWSNLIVRGKLVGVSDRVEIKAMIIKPNNKNESQTSAVYWYRLYSIEVEQVFEGGAKPGHRIELIRFFGKTESAINAPTRPGCKYLNRDAVGKSFVLLLRPEQDLKIDPPPVWTDSKVTDIRDYEVHGTRAYAPIFVAPADSLKEDQIKNVIDAARKREKAFKDEDMKAWAQRVGDAKTDQEAEEPMRELRNVGFRAVSRIKGVRDKKETSDIGRERLAKLAIELSPPPFAIEMGAVE